MSDEEYEVNEAVGAVPIAQRTPQAVYLIRMNG